MAVARQGKSITMTANGDSIAAGNYFFVAGITFQGSTLTAGQRLLLTDAGGSILCDHIVLATAESVDLWNGRAPMYADGLTLTGPAAGTWVLTIFLD